MSKPLRHIGPLDYVTIFVPNSWLLGVVCYPRHPVSVITLDGEDKRLSVGELTIHLGPLQFFFWWGRLREAGKA